MLNHMIGGRRVGLARTALLVAAVPGLMLIGFTVLLLVRGRLGLAAIVLGAGVTMTLLVVATTRVRLRLLHAALAGVPSQAQPQAWRDAARGGPPEDEQARAWAARLARYHVMRMRGVGLVDPIVLATLAVVFSVFAVIHSPWLGLVAAYCLVRAATFIVNWFHYRRRLAVLS